MTAPIRMTAPTPPDAPSDHCSDCPPPGYPTDETRCAECPRAAASEGPSLAEMLRAVTEDDAYARPWTFGETCKAAADELDRLSALLTAATERADMAEERWAGSETALEIWTAQADAKIEQAEAALTEMTRRRDEWRKKAEGYDDLRNAVREKAKAAGPSIGRALLIGSIVDKDAEIAELRAALARKDAEAAEVDAARIEAETAVGYHKEKLRQAEVERDEWRDRAEKERSAKKRAEAALAEKAAGWQLIESAPKDGTRFLAYEPGDYYQRYECWWQDDFTVWVGWQNDWDNEPEPTHWMPLPAAPALAEKGDARDA